MSKKSGRVVTVPVKFPEKFAKSIGIIMATGIDVAMHHKAGLTAALQCQFEPLIPGKSQEWWDDTARKVWEALDLSDIQVDAHGAGQESALSSMIEHISAQLRGMKPGPCKYNHRPGKLCVKCGQRGEFPALLDTEKKELWAGLARPPCKPWCGLVMSDALRVAQEFNVDDGGVRRFKSLQRESGQTQVFCTPECRNKFARLVHEFVETVGDVGCADCGRGENAPVHYHAGARR